MREWLAPPEQALVAAAGDPAQVANLVWTAKEAAAKVRREGLRLDVRSAVTRLPERPAVARLAPAGGGLDARGRPTTAGWWRTDPGWVMAVAATPDAPPPSRLDVPQI